MAVRVVLEIGDKRVFAIAVDWPGLARSGKDEAAALATMVAYGPRYGAVLPGVSGFVAPAGVEQLDVVEVVAGSSATDFGVPRAAFAGDVEPLHAAELDRQTAILRGCFAAFDAAIAAATGLTLRTGPRGGGRSLDGIGHHVAESDEAYVKAIGGTYPPGATHDVVRDALIGAIAARNRGEIADVGPRGGKRWSASLALRYTAWHSLDHAWEIEDRIAC